MTLADRQRDRQTLIAILVAALLTRTRRPPCPPDQRTSSVHRSNLATPPTYTSTPTALTDSAPGAAGVAPWRHPIRAAPVESL